MNLEKLDLSYSSVSDEGVRDIVELKKLRWLDLSGCSIGPGGLRANEHIRS